MRMFIILFLLPTLAIAQAPDINPENIITKFEWDWNEDGTKDRAILVQNVDEVSADLYIGFGKPGKRGFDVMVHAKDFVWSGGMGGQTPYFGVNEAGSLLVFSLNEGIGSNHWQMTLTVAYRNDDFIVAGFTYSDWDTHDEDNFGTCDINLLTGNGFVSRGDDPAIKIVTLQNALPAAEWDMNILPMECFE